MRGVFWIMGKKVKKDLMEEIIKQLEEYEEGTDPRKNPIDLGE